MDSGSATIATVRPGNGVGAQAVEPIALAEDRDQLGREQVGKGRFAAVSARGRGSVHPLIPEQRNCEQILADLPLFPIARLCGGSMRQVTSFSPTMPATISPTQPSRSAVAGSANRMMPRITVPTAPMPVQTA